MRRRHLMNAAGAILLSLAVCGCQNSGVTRRAPSMTRLPSGFSIDEAESVGFRVRSDFDEANRAIADGDYKRGIEMLSAIAESEPGFAAAHINLAIAHQRAGDLEGAEAALGHALEANPRHPVAHNELGIVYRRTGRFSKARESYESALALQPAYHHARKNLAVLCDLYLSDLTCALDNYRLYLESDPQDESAGIWIADLEGRVGQKED